MGLYFLLCPFLSLRGQRDLGEPYPRIIFWGAAACGLPGAREVLCGVPRDHSPDRTRKLLRPAKASCLTWAYTLASAFSLPKFSSTPKTRCSRNVLPWRDPGFPSQEVKSCGKAVTRLACSASRLASLKRASEPLRSLQPCNGKA